ncbi:hypothetical protein J2Z64_001670 [Oceanobacillus polygoni]|uniref:Uncharacterized protein n=1 Tax=Oceanobacillus polygoni TaxID=1235259 RepID=A0A9X0YRK5_9BACI|nr:hypothetical protein [Oceanobacillus polygoni]
MYFLNNQLDTFVAHCNHFHLHLYLNQLNDQASELIVT